jgi:hypothetical protein
MASEIAPSCANMSTAEYLSNALERMEDIATQAAREGGFNSAIVARKEALDIRERLDKAKRMARNSRTDVEILADLLDEVKRLDGPQLRILADAIARRVQS